MKKPEGSNKLKRIAALLWLAGALELDERRHRKCPVIFFPIFSLAGHLILFSKQGGSR